MRLRNEERSQACLSFERSAEGTGEAGRPRNGERSQACLSFERSAEGDRLRSAAQRRGQRRYRASKTLKVVEVGHRDISNGLRKVYVFGRYNPVL